MSPDDSSQFVPRNWVGGTSFVFGVVALVFAFVPIVGEFVAAPAALLAVVLGLMGLERVWRGIATNGAEAVIGSLLGTVAGLFLLLVTAATAGPLG
ncbi:MAG: hypothetical protein ACOC96_05825 [Actinomycetota bacterium]